MPTVNGDPSLLLYNFLEIEAAVAPFALVALRKESRRAMLNNAINARQNAYYAKYANAAAIASKMKQYYSESVTGSKMQRLEVLAGIATTQWDLLKDRYTKDKRTGVVTTTSSQLYSDTTSYGFSAESGFTAASSISGTVSPGAAVVPPVVGEGGRTCRSRRGQ